MNRQDFFKDIMEICNWDAENDDEILAPLIEHLSKQSDDEIFSFDNIMTKLLYELDTRENYEKAEKISPQSDDSFLYSRCVALINGEEYYKQVLDGKISQIWNMEFEEILYVPMRAWAMKYDKDIDEYPHYTDLSYETGSNDDKWI